MTAETAPHGAADTSFDDPFAYANDTDDGHTLTYDTGDGPLHYRDTGTGPALVLLHGGFLDHRMWQAQIAAFADRYRVIAPDARGHGRSANGTRPFRHTDDLAALLRHLDTGPAVLAGVSMGAATAVDTALEHPDVVRGLVISGAGTGEPEWRDPWVLANLAEWARTTAAGDVEGFVAAHLLFAAGPHRELDDVDPEMVRRLRAMALGTTAKHTGTTPLEMLPVPGAWERAAGITVPLLAVNGGLDSPDHIGMAERLAATVRNGRTVTLDGTAHYPSMERPERYNALLAEFLRELEGGA